MELNYVQVTNISFLLREIDVNLMGDRRSWWINRDIVSFAEKSNGMHNENSEIKKGTWRKYANPLINE